jgi:hypothetical protein
VMTTLGGESSHRRPSHTRMRPPPSGLVQVGLSPAIGRSLQHVCRYESSRVVRCCRVDSAIAPTSSRDHSGQNPAERQFAQYW